MSDAGDFGAWLSQAREVLRGSAGNWTVRPNQDGTCPLLSCGNCTIYAQRPRTCLEYDCRVLAAAGIDAGGDDKAVINRRVHEWRFQFATDEERHAHLAERAHFPAGYAPLNPLGIAALALRVYPVFLPPGPPARAVVAASAAFDTGASA